MATFNEALRRLIQDSDIQNLDATELEALLGDNKEELWKDLSEFMKAEGGLLTHYPIFQSDFGGESLYKILNDYIDLDSDTAPSWNFDDILAHISGKSDDSTDSDQFWNESVAKALRYYCHHIDPRLAVQNESISYNTDGTEVTDFKGAIPVNSATATGAVTGFRITDVKKANAGKSFKNKPWVIPNYNIDSKTYDGVRGDDKINEVLTSHKEMQFTHTQAQHYFDDDAYITELNKYLRLLMPKYLRRVEVEDLDRNFWVIGQVLSAISAYLFDEDSPIAQEFKNILDELVQIWENIIYLWAALALILKKPTYTKVHCEAVYLPNSGYADSYQFDNFEANEIDFEEIKKRLQYLVDSYPDCNLCIAPILRKNNYEKNYYSIEHYPYICLYDRNNESWSIHALNLDSVGDGNYIKEYTSGDTTVGVAINLTNQTTQNNIGAIHENEDTYDYIAPFSSVNTTTYGDSKKYYGLLRVIPTFNPEEVPYIDGIFYVTFSLEVQDVSRRLINPSYQIDGGRERIVWGMHNDEVRKVTSTDIVRNTGISNNIEKGYYQGELVSYFKRSQAAAPRLFIDWIPIELTPITFDGDVSDLKNSFSGSGNTTALNLSDQFSNVIEDQVNSNNGDTNISIYVGDHRAVAREATTSLTTEKYFATNGNQYRYTQQGYQLIKNNTYFDETTINNWNNRTFNAHVYNSIVLQYNNTIYKNFGNFYFITDLLKNTAKFPYNGDNVAQRGTYFIETLYKPQGGTLSENNFAIKLVIVDVDFIDNDPDTDSDNIYIPNQTIGLYRIPDNNANIKYFGQVSNVFKGFFVVQNGTASLLYNLRWDSSNGNNFWSENIDTTGWEQERSVNQFVLYDYRGSENGTTYRWTNSGFDFENYPKLGHSMG